MRKIILILLIVFVLIPAILVGTGWVLLKNEEFLKRQVGRVALEQTGRELHIDGLLQLDLGRQTRLLAEGIRFQNADWADASEMVRLGRLDVTLDIPSLFNDRPFIPSVSIEDCEVLLIRNDAGEANWDVLPAPDPDLAPVEPPAQKQLPVRLQEARISNCHLNYDTVQRAQPLSLEAEALTLQISENQRIEGKGSGQFNDRPFSFDGHFSPQNAFIAGGPVEHQLDASLGDISLSSFGSMEDALEMTGVNLDAHFSGSDIGRILAEYELPALSEGAFDFKARLNTVGRMTQIDIDGDLGSLLLQANGELDRLNQPQYGKVNFTMEGPDLQALGNALGAEGLVAEPFMLNGQAVFDQGVMRAEPLVFETAQDSIEASGALGPAPEFAGSDIEIQLLSREVGRWRGRLGLPEGLLGGVEVKAHLTSDAQGVFTVSSDLEHQSASIKAKGLLGSFHGILQPDLDIDVRVPDLKSLGAIVGRDDLPSSPATATGRLVLDGEKLRLQPLNLDIAGNRARLNGVVSLANDYSGSVMDLDFNSPDLSLLGTMLGQELPGAAADLKGSLSYEDQLVTIQSLDVDLAGHTAAVKGSLSLAEGFAGSTLDLIMGSPNVAALAALFGKEGLPAEPVALEASLGLVGNAVDFEISNGAAMSDIALDISGRIADRDNPLAVDARIDIGLPSLRTIEFLVPGTTLPDQPFTARGSLANEKTMTRLSSVQLTLGHMRASIDGDINHDRRLNLSLEVDGPDASVFSELAGQALPQDPYSLAARIEGTPESFDIDDLAMMLGESRVNGDLAFKRGKRTAVSGRIDVPHLDLAWTQGTNGSEEPEPEEASREWLFDDTESLKVGDYGVDLDLGVNIAMLDLGNTAIKDIQLGMQLAPNVLQLNLISLSGLIGGTIAGELLMDARDGPTELRYELNGSALRLGLLAVEGQDAQTYPPIDLQVHFDSRGATQREMMSALNGKVRLYLGSGQVASAGAGLIFSDFISELFSLLNPFSKSSEFTRLDCAVVAADITDGQAEVFPIVFNTSDITIVSEGSVDLKTEKLDFSFNTKPRKGVGLSAGVLVNPFIKVGGRLVSPTVELDPEKAVVSSGLAVATAGISLLAKSVSDRFLSSKDPCGDARKEIDKKESGQ